MPLPVDARTAWPPDSWAGPHSDILEAAAWYGGDEQSLAAFYGNSTARRYGVSSTSLGDLLSRARFWSRRNNDLGTDRQRLHVPAASDVAATSADLLFGETPTLTIPEAHESKAESAAKATEDRLQELVELDGIASTLLEGAEIGAGLGGVYLRPVWDPNTADHPMLTVIHPDYAVPEFRWSQLVAVTFWREVRRENSLVWRHLERHEPGVILHGLYAGTEQNLGTRRPLDSLTETSSLAVDSDEAVVLPGNIAGLACRYVPNVLPNRKHRGIPVGRADTANVEPLMDALDETWSSWMRDIRLGKARIIVPNEFLHRAGRGTGATFDPDREVYSPLDMDPASHEKAGITQVQFQIRTEDHARTCGALFEQIVRGAGYSPQTFGLTGDGGEATATEVRAKESRSLRTTGRKQRYWKRVEDIGEIMLIIDREIFGSKIEPMRPRLDFADGLPDDPQSTATTLELFARAQAMSIETRVKMAQPHLDEAEVKAEVQRILSETGVAVTDPTGAGGFGGGGAA